MSTNTVRHVSDESVYKIFNPVGTSFPTNITNVQAALAAIKPVALNGVPNATQSIVGILRLATQQEVDDGTLNGVAVSPATLKASITKPPATTVIAGISRYATDPEAIAGSISNATIVPSSLKAALNNAFNTRQATEVALGVAKISTLPAALAGTDDLTIMTPKKVAAAITDATKKIPTYGTATTTNNGLVRIATDGEVQTGNLRDGVSVSPAGLKSLTATQARSGLISIASQAEVAAGTLGTKAVTPVTLLSRTGAVGRLGLVKLTTTVGSGDGNTALAYNADVMHTRGGQTINGALSITGNLNVNGNLTKSGKQVVTTDMLGDDVPIGVMLMWPSGVNPPAKWHEADGWNSYLNNPAYAELQRVYPNGLPDTRGLFMRGQGAGVHITSQQGNDSKGKPRLGVGCSGAGVGQVQSQMVRRHKHASAWGERNDRSWGKYGCTVRFGYVGSQRTDWDNYSFFTNDGDEIEAENIRDSFGTMNSEGLMGNENRPWNMSVRYIIKIS